MASQETVTAEADAEATPPKRSKKKLVIIVAVVALGGAGYTVMSGGKKPAKAGATATHTVELGPVINLDSITLNLADGHYLKVGVALQLSKTAKSGDFSNNDAKTLDATISVFGSRTVPQLSAPGVGTRPSPNCPNGSKPSIPEKSSASTSPISSCSERP